MTDRRPTARTFPRPDPVPVATGVPYSFVHINKCGGSSVEIALGIAKRHASAQTLRAEIGEQAWAARFTFALVRNPFDRIASLFHYRVRTDQNGLGDRHISFNRWVERVWAVRDPRYSDQSILLAPARDWLVDGTGRIIVDTVARLETIGDDWARIARRLGVDKPLPVTNWNRRPAYRALYAPGSRALIETAFAADLDTFDYSF